MSLFTVIPLTLKGKRFMYYKEKSNTINVHLYGASVKPRALHYAPPLVPNINIFYKLQGSEVRNWYLPSTV